MKEQLGNVETNKRGVETTVKENEKQDVANDGATLSWKRTSSLAGRRVKATRSKICDTS